MTSNFDSFKAKAVQGLKTVFEISKTRSVPDEQLSETILIIYHAMVYSAYVKKMFLETEGELYEKENDYLELADVAQGWNALEDMDIENVIKILAIMKHKGDTVKAKRHVEICHEIVSRKFKAMTKEMNNSGEFYV